MSTIAEQLQELAQIKEEIRQAIINKGVTVASDAAFSTYATAIGQISGGGGGYSVDDIKAIISRTSSEDVVFTLPTGITKIGNAAFKGCSFLSLTSLSLPNTITAIEANAFESTGITSIVIPDSVTTIGNYAFMTCNKLESITLPSNITSIGSQTIDRCPKLASITIPSGVTSIGNYCFRGCNMLGTFTCLCTTPPTVGAQTFGSGSTDYMGRSVAAGSRILYVPHGCSSAYQSATGGWATLLDSTKCGFSIAELNADGTKPNS